LLGNDRTDAVMSQDGLESPRGGAEMARGTPGLISEGEHSELWRDSRYRRKRRGQRSRRGRDWWLHSGVWALVHWSRRSQAWEASALALPGAFVSMATLGLARRNDFEMGEETCGSCGVRGRV